MAKSEKINQKFEELGIVDQLPNSCIVVQFAAQNLSEKFARYLYKVEPYRILQICKDSIAIAELSLFTHEIKDAEVLKIPFDSIKSVSIEEKGFDYLLSLELDDGPVTLLVQQKELAFLRSSGGISVDNFLGNKNWHAENLDNTLKTLKALNK